MIKNKNSEKIFSQIYNFEEVVRYINSNKDKTFKDVFKRINNYLLELSSTFEEKIKDLKLTSFHRLSSQKHDYIFYSIKNKVYYNFFFFEKNQIMFEKDKQFLLKYEREFGYNFQISSSKSMQYLQEDEVKNLKLDFLNKYKDTNLYINFELVDNIFKIEEISFEEITFENYDNDKFLDFIEHFYKIQVENNEPYFWLPDDIMGAIGIKDDGSYFIYDLNRISWYPCNNLNYFYLTRILPFNTNFYIKKVLDEKTDMLFIKEFWSKYDDLKIIKKYRDVREIEKLFK